MSSPFDGVAAHYDADFTHTLIGRAQRARVHRLLSRLTGTAPLTILEINCGTGEDAVHLAGAGHTVTASDISAEMLGIAEAKARARSVVIHTLQWDLRTPYPGTATTYNLIFSNFGGLNCLDPTALQQTFARVHDLLKPDGVFVGVVMGKCCLMESVYMLFTGRWRSINRRGRDGMVSVPLQSGAFVDTWYYSPSEIATALRPQFDQLFMAPVGVTIPPGYMESRTPWKKALNTFCIAIDPLFSHALFARCSDHFCFAYKKRG